MILWWIVEAFGMLMYKLFEVSAVALVAYVIYVVIKHWRKEE